MERPESPNVLIIEDDHAIALSIRDLLVESGFRSTVCRNGSEGLSASAEQDFDLIILDVNLPGISGLDVCRQVKQQSPNLPIIMLTARTEEADVVAGLELGADDYVCKPFKPRELLARVRTRLRERTQRIVRAAVAPSEGQQQSDILLIGDLEIDFHKMKLQKDGKPVEVSAREFDFLAILARDPGRPFQRDHLLDAVWGVENPSYGPNVSVFVSRLRKKIESDPVNPKYLLTVRGVGYRFAEPDEIDNP